MEKISAKMSVIREAAKKIKGIKKIPRKSPLSLMGSFATPTPRVSRIVKSPNPPSNFVELERFQKAIKAQIPENIKIKGKLSGPN